MDGKSKSIILYEDDDLVIAIRDHVATPGQISIIPKQHYTIMEMVPNKLLEKCASLANKVGVAVFEGLGAQGTNIIVRNGLGAGQTVPHFSIDVIPRQENDALNLQWEPQQIMEDEMEITFNSLKELSSQIKLEEPKIETKEPALESKKEEKIDNYLLKSTQRLP